METEYAFTGHHICGVTGHLRTTVRLRARCLASAAPCKRMQFRGVAEIGQFNPVNGYETKAVMKIKPSIPPAAAVFLLAGAALMAVLPYAASTYTVRGANGFLCFLVLAHCFNLLGGHSGYFNLGQGVFWGAGAYGFGLCLQTGCGEWTALAAVAVGATLAGRLMAPLLFRLRGETFALVNLALLYVFLMFALRLRDVTGGADGFYLASGGRLTAAFYGQCLLAIMISITALRLPGSRFGYQLQALGQDAVAAASLGIDTRRVKIRLFVLCAPFLAVSGGLFMMAEGYIIPSTVFGLRMSLMPVAMAMVGGAGRPTGPLWGTLIVFGIQEWLWLYAGSMAQTLLGVMLIVAGKRKAIVRRLQSVVTAWT